mgnify:CR=1 FL=1
MRSANCINQLTLVYSKWAHRFILEFEDNSNINMIKNLNNFNVTTDINRGGRLYMMPKFRLSLMQSDTKDNPLQSWNYKCQWLYPILRDKGKQNLDPVPIYYFYGSCNYIGDERNPSFSSTCEVGHCNRLEVRRCFFWYKCNNLDPPITYINSYPQINYLHIIQYENSFLTFSLMLLQKSNYLDKSVSFSWLRFLYLSPKTNPFSPIHTIRKLPKYYYFCFLAFYYMLSSIFEQKTHSRSVSGSLPHTIIDIETEAPHLLR